MPDVPAVPLAVVRRERGLMARRAPRAPRVGPIQPPPAIIRSKVQSPVVRDTTLARSRLLDWLERHATDRVRLVVAEAGHGKTTLLADHARRSAGTTLWYRMETSDGDWMTALAYLVAAVREAVPEFGVSTLNLLGQVATMGPSIDVALSSFLADLGSVADRPVTLILDDIHVVQDSPDIQAIVGRLFERAPESMRFILAGRRRVDLKLGRLRAQGSVAQLTTQDLRFSRRETEDLLTVTYGLAVDDELLDIIDGRTEGWAASLQLVASSLHARRPREVRAFARELSGTNEPLYDFLAEEVLARQTPTMREVLTHASLLARIVPNLVIAALSVRPDPPGADSIADHLDEADALGLMSRIASDGASRRLHPLLREFLMRQLTVETPAEVLREMHLRIARTAEPTDWLAAAHHFIEADDHPEAMRVLKESTLRTLGTGAWGPATELIARMPAIEPPIAVQVIRARALVAAGRADDALALLDSLPREVDDPTDRALVGLARASATHYSGDRLGLERALMSILADDSTPPQIMQIARAWALILEASGGLPLEPTLRALTAVAEDQRRAGLHYYAAISLHNAALVLLALGRFSDAIERCHAALTEFRHLGVEPGESSSTHACLALALAESGDVKQALEAVRDVARHPYARVDALADCAWLMSALGDFDGAWNLLDLATAASVHGAQEIGASEAVRYAMVALHQGSGDLDASRQALGAANVDSIDFDAQLRSHFMEASQALLEGGTTSSAARLGLELAKRQGAERWVHPLAVLASIESADWVALRRLATVAARRTPTTFLALANALANHLDRLEPVSEEVDASMRAHPDRWLPAVRRALLSGSVPLASAAARLLGRLGDATDIPALVRFEREHIRRAQLRTMSGALIRRVTPTLLLHDLGRVAYQVGDRTVRVSQTRRKAAGLLMYLVSRPRQTATREQVLDDLWPEQDPAGATNSLHQTLYFLRRDIEPRYDDGLFADYVVVESDVVYLDAELVQVGSVAFFRQASEVLSSSAVGRQGLVVLREYKGRFAPEFEYDEWSMSWRDLVHSTYLRLAEEAAQELVAQGSTQEACTALTSALATDPTAIEIETLLVHCLWRHGARAAAAQQYSHLVGAYREVYAVDPPSLAELADDPRHSRP